MMVTWASLEGLGLFLVALMVGLLVFSSALYYAELDQPASQIHSTALLHRQLPLIGSSIDRLIDWFIYSLIYLRLLFELVLPDGELLD